MPPQSPPQLNPLYGPLQQVAHSMFSLVLPYPFQYLSYLFQSGQQIYNLNCLNKKTLVRQTLFKHHSTIPALLQLWDQTSILSLWHGGLSDLLINVLDGQFVGTLLAFALATPNPREQAIFMFGTQTVYQFITYPLRFAFNRVVVNHDPGTNSNMITCLRETWRREGISTWWSGFIPFMLTRPWPYLHLFLSARRTYTPNYARIANLDIITHAANCLSLTLTHPFQLAHFRLCQPPSNYPDLLTNYLPPQTGPVVKVESKAHFEQIINDSGDAYVIVVYLLQGSRKSRGLLAQCHKYASKVDSVVVASVDVSITPGIPNSKSPPFIELWGSKRKLAASESPDLKPILESMYKLGPRPGIPPETDPRQAKAPVRIVPEYKYTNTFGVWKDAYETDGITGLFAGLGPRMFWWGSITLSSIFIFQNMADSLLHLLHDEDTIKAFKELEKRNTAMLKAVSESQKQAQVNQATSSGADLVHV